MLVSTLTREITTAKTAPNRVGEIGKARCRTQPRPQPKGKAMTADRRVFRKFMVVLNNLGPRALLWAAYDGSPDWDCFPSWWLGFGGETWTATGLW